MNRIELNDLGATRKLSPAEQAGVAGGVYPLSAASLAGAWAVVQWHDNQMNRINQWLSGSASRLLRPGGGSNKNNRPCTLRYWNGRFGYCE